MTAIYELIERTEESSEKMHEMMVDAVRSLREEQQRLQQFEKEVLTFAEGTPEYERLNYLAQRARKSIDDYQFLFNICRTALDIDNKVLNLYKDNEDDTNISTPQ